MKDAIVRNNTQYYFRPYDRETELVELFGKHHQAIIAKQSTWLPLQRKMKPQRRNYRDSIGDGFLFAWDTPSTPKLYLTEIELHKHRLQHIVEQIGNLISFIQKANAESQEWVRSEIYKAIKNQKSAFQQMRDDTGEEVAVLLNNAFEDPEILLVIDRLSPELSIGLSQIESALRVKIRKVEVRHFSAEQNHDHMILFTDSEASPEREVTTEEEIYTINYHLEGKPKSIVALVQGLIGHAQKRGLKIAPVKHWIGFFANGGMVFSCIPRKSKIVCYSKAPARQAAAPGLPIRDVRKIGHYTNHLPTEIVVTEEHELPLVKAYFDKVLAKFGGERAKQT